MEIKNVKPRIAQFWIDLLASKKLVAVENQRGRTVGYLVKHPFKKNEPHSDAKVGKTHNHGKKSSKASRLIAKKSQSANRACESARKTRRSKPTGSRRIKR